MPVVVDKCNGRNNYRNYPLGLLLVLHHMPEGPSPNIQARMESRGVISGCNQGLGLGLLGRVCFSRVQVLSFCFKAWP